MNAYVKRYLKKPPFWRNQRKDRKGISWASQQPHMDIRCPSFHRKPARNLPKVPCIFEANKNRSVLLDFFSGNLGLLLLKKKNKSYQTEEQRNTLTESDRHRPENTPAGGPVLGARPGFGQHARWSFHRERLLRLSQEHHLRGYLGEHHNSFDAPRESRESRNMKSHESQYISIF